MLITLAQAAQALKEGQLVAFPTETVYGLGADANNDAAVSAVFAAKGRPAHHPLIVHVQNAAQAAHFATHLPPLAERLMQHFWPGPLTLILPRHPGVATAAAGGQASIGLRCPAHPVAQALLQAAQALGVSGVAAPSANRFGRISPTTAAHVADDFGDSLAVLDGGPCEVGIESSIVDLSRTDPVLLRPGGISRADLQAAMGQRFADPEAMAQEAPRASGTLQAHYAPRAKLRLMDARTLDTALQVLGADVDGIALYTRQAIRVPGRSMRRYAMPHDARVAARRLFADLREIDATGVRLIWVETPPDGPEWEGVHDRLRRAAAA